MRKIIISILISLGIVLGAPATVKAAPTAGVVSILSKYNKIKLVDWPKIQSAPVEASSTSAPAQEPYYVEVTSNGLYIRKEASADADKIDLLAKGDKVLVKESDDEEWLQVKLDDNWYYIAAQYVSKDVSDNAHLVEKQSDIIKVMVQKQSSSYALYKFSNCISATNADKEWIALKESGGDYNAHTSGTSYYGRYQLHYSLLKGDHSPANQERVVEEYVKNRYGTWAKAKRHWLAYHWY